METPKEKADIARERLEKVFGWRELIPRRDPMHELISTILSQRTTGANEDKAYHQMRDRFGSWENIQRAPLDELIATIELSNFAEVKAPRIQQVIGQIIEKVGKPSIDHLADMPTQDALIWLMSLPGVGLKTATLVLLFNFKKPVMPVDTHVHRVSQRLGIITPKTTAEKAHAILLKLLPEDPVVLYNFHIHFLKHGQKVCTWASPRCENCVLTDICDWYKANRK